MATLLLLTPSVPPPGVAADRRLGGTAQAAADVLPALALLPHDVRVLPAEASALLDAPPADAVLVDGRTDLAHIRGLTRLVRSTGIDIPLLLVLTEGGLAVVADDWGMDDVLLVESGPAEVEARLRLVVGRIAQAHGDHDDRQVIRSGGLAIDEAAYTARLDDRALDLTFKEFELVKFLAQHPGRVFTRQQLLQEVWGYDYFGGTRTVDVHVRRLRAKLGPDHEQLIGTVRNVGYRFVVSAERRARTRGRSARREQSDASAGDDAPVGSAQPRRSSPCL